MGTYQNIGDEDLLFCPSWEDTGFERFSFDETLGACPSQLSQLTSFQENQQETTHQLQASDDRASIDTVLDIISPSFADIDGGFNLFPGLDFSVTMAENDTSFNSVFTPSYGSTTPGAYPSTTSDAFSLSPRRLSVSLSSPRPLAPRPIAPTPPVQEESLETTHDPADQAVSQLKGNPAITAAPFLPAESPRPSINRRPRRRRDGPFLLARERRKQEKPEECPICSKGHPYKADLKKHIAARHKDEAPKLGVSTARFRCIVVGCFQTFARKDHLLRHKKRKHNGSS